jgi:ABC-type amino acid transport system permease subunit
MLDWVLYQRLVTGLPSVWPSGLALTWALFLAAAAMALPSAYALACITARYARIGAGVASVLGVVRGTPPLIVIFAVDHLLTLSAFAKATLALTLYSISHLFPVFVGFARSYPADLRDVEAVHQVGWIQRHVHLRLPWIAERSFPAMQTHLISLFKDTSIVVVIGLLDMAALASLLASRAYDLSAWIVIFGACSILYLLNVQIVNAVSTMICRSLFWPGSAALRATIS